MGIETGILSLFRFFIGYWINRGWIFILALFFEKNNHLQNLLYCRLTPIFSVVFKTHECVNIVTHSQKYITVLWKKFGNFNAGSIADGGHKSGYNT
jgi:hypothetical protein